MKVVVLTHYVTAYRIPTFQALARKVDLTLLLSSRLSDPGLASSGLRVRILPSILVPRRRRHPTGYVETYKLHLPYGVYRALADIDADVVHAHELGLRTLMATAYKTRHDRPMVVHADLSEHTERKWGAIRTGLRRWLLARADRVAVNGASGQRYIEGLGVVPERIDRLPFATDAEVFSSVQPLWRRDGTRRLLYVGRLIELKGLESFIAALAGYLRTRPALRAEFLIAGHGEREASIRAVPRPDNLSLTLLGAVPYEQLGAVYAQADTFVLPTLGDTWGLVVNESMSAGLPVLGSVLAQAAVELVADGRSGWLFDPRSPQETERAIDRFFTTPAEALPGMGACAREAALAIGPERVAQLMVDSCERALHEHGARR